MMVAPASLISCWVPEPLFEMLLLSWKVRVPPLAFSIVTPPTVIFAVALSLVLGIAAGVVASLRLVRTPPLALFGR